MQSQIPTYARWLLLGSLILLFPLFISLGSFQPLYYVLWVLGVGGYVSRRWRELTVRFAKWHTAPFIKFMSIAVLMILLEEMFATLAMHLMRYIETGSFITYPRDLLQFWTLNLLALPGMCIGWYLLLRRYAYTKTEIFVLAGLFGIYAEKVHEHVLNYPLFGWLLIVPTIFTYGLLLSIPALSLDHTTGKRTNRVYRYLAAFVIPFLCTVPFIGILSILYAHHPGFFPPFGYFGDTYGVR